MMIAHDSVLMRLPGQLSDQEIIFFDGIRYSILMTESAYEELESLLNVHTLKDGSPPELEALSSIVRIRIFQLAWSIVDSLQRLRSLLDKPNFPLKELEFIKVFRGRTHAVWGLRTTIEHFDRKISHLITEKTASAFGTLSWVTTYLKDKKIHIWLLGSGTLRSKTKQMPVVNPAGKYLKMNGVDLITLKLLDDEINLTDMMAHLKEMTLELEKKMLAEYPDFYETANGGDLAVCAVVEF